MLKDKIKILASDTLTYGIFQTFSRFFTFLLTPLYSNYLTTQDNGIMAYIFSLIIFLQFTYAFGMEAAFFRFFNKNDEAKNKKVFSNAYIFIALVSSFFTLLILFFSEPIAKEMIGADVENSIYILQIACLIPFFDGLIAIPYGRLRMIREIKRFAITKFLLVLLSVLLTAYFVIFTNLGLIGVFIGTLISSTVGIIIFLPNILKMLDFNIDKKLFAEMFKFGLPTLPSNLSIIILQVADRPIMKMFISNAEIGIYQINAKLAVPMLMFVSVFDYAWKPFFLTNYNDDEAKKLFSRVLTYFLLVASLIFLVISLFIEYIVRIPLWSGRYFIHPDYWSGMSVVSIIMLGYLLNGVTTNFAAVFHIEKKTKYLPVAVGISAIISICMNFILIPLIGMYGAAISLLVGYFSGTIIMKYLHSKVDYKINYEWKRIIILIIVTTLLYIGNRILVGQNIGLELLFIIKIIIFLAYILLLRVFNFFTVGEIKQLKKIFGK